jgi:hypothetical protein
MKPEWRTNPGVPMDLSDQDSSTVEAYFHWLYTHKLVSQSVKTYGALAFLYVFGLFLMDATFQEAVLHAIIDHLETHKWAPTASNIKAGYDGTAKGDLARRLMVDIFVHHGTLTLSAVKNPSLFEGTDFLEELIPELFAQRGRPNANVKPWERFDYYRAGCELGNAEVASDNEKKRRKITAEDYL